MAEQTPSIQNKRLLVVAILLATAVVVVYNLHVSRIRKGFEGGKVKLLRVNRQMLPGETITAKDLDVVAVPESLAKSLGNAVYAEDRFTVESSTVNQKIEKGQYLLWSHVIGETEDRPSRTISEGMVAVALRLAPQPTLGDILRVGDRVNVLGYLPSGGGKYKAYRIIEAVKVHTVGGRGRVESVKTSRRAGSTDGLRTYSSVSVEVPKSESLKLYNVLSHVKSGQVWLELLNPDEPLPLNAERVNPQLEKLAETAAQTPGARR